MEQLRNFVPVLVPVRIGIPGIDGQHEALYGYLNDFIRLNLSAQLGREAVKTAFDHLVDYTLSHFDDEEFFQRSIRYPGFETHAELHQMLRERVDEFGGRFEQQEELREFTAEIIEFLKDWLGHHILVEDMKFAEYYNSRPAEK